MIIMIICSVFSFFRKESDDWGWSADNEWSETKASSSSDKAAKKPTSGSGIAKKKMEPKSKATNEDLLIDFGASGGGKGSEKKTSEDSWANWENDAWESLSKKD